MRSGWSLFLVSLVAVTAMTWLAGCGGSDSSDGASNDSSSDAEVAVTTPDGETMTIDVEDDGEDGPTKLTITGNSEERTVTATDEDGNEAFTLKGTSDLPDGFPDEVPLYDGWTIKSSIATTQNGKNNFMVQGETSDSVAKVTETYKKALTDKGFEIKATMNMPQGANIMSEKGDTAVVATVGEKDGKTILNLTIAMK
jgi:hypothetical protein